MNLTTFRAFTNRNYRLFFAGQSISLLGTWMQKTAVSWVIYAQTHSKVMLGVSVFATLFPSAVFTSLGGVVSDRYNRYRVLLNTQVLSMVQAILLTLVVYLSANAVWPIIGLSVLLGVVNGFDVPARQSLVYELVDDKTDLPNALALNSSMVNLAKFVGPALAGIIIEQLGEVVCFGINALSFVAVIGSLTQMKLPVYQSQKHSKNLWGELREGVQYVRQTPSIRFIILMLGLSSLLVLPFTTLMPVYAKDVFGGTAATFGWMDSAIGLGALVGALFLASLTAGTDLRKVLTRNTFVFGCGLILFSHTTWYPLALLFLVMGAFGMMSQVTISNTLIQTSVAPAMRGRVISLFVMAYTAMLPVGSLLVGSVSHYVGVQNTVLGEGITALLIGVLHRHFWQKTRARQPVSPVPATASPMLALPVTESD